MVCRWSEGTSLNLWYTVTYSMGCFSVATNQLYERSIEFHNNFISDTQHSTIHTVQLRTVFQSRRAFTFSHPELTAGKTAEKSHQRAPPRKYHVDAQLLTTMQPRQPNWQGTLK